MFESLVYQLLDHLCHKQHFRTLSRAQSKARGSRSQCSMMGCTASMSLKEMPAIVRGSCNLSAPARVGGSGIAGGLGYQGLGVSLVTGVEWFF